MTNLSLNSRTFTLNFEEGIKEAPKNINKNPGINGNVKASIPITMIMLAIIVKPIFLLILAIFNIFYSTCILRR